MIKFQNQSVIVKNYNSQKFVSVNVMKLGPYSQGLVFFITYTRLARAGIG
jgi:hypothetical protein